MITMGKAKSIALEQISDGFHISSILEGSMYWYFGVKNDGGLILPGISPITVNKENGEIDATPSIPYYVLNKDPLPIEQDYENAVTIM